MKINFIDAIKDELITCLESKGGKLGGNYINNIRCPSCNEPEAYTFVEDPTIIHCNRKKNCGLSIHAKQFAPHLFCNWSSRFPATKEDSKRTAKFYLKSRGLDTSRFEFEQGQWKEDDWERNTVAFKCDWTGRRWHRLIDPPTGVRKTRWDSGNGVAYRGYAWMNQQVDPEVELWVVEGIIEALSLQQGVGIQAAATFSSSHVPSIFYESLERNQKIVIALNSDSAGKDGTLKNIQKLKDLGFSNVTAAQPLVGMDWNDLLVVGAFKEENQQQTIKDALWHGRLLLASNFVEYRRVYEERHGASEKSGLYEGLLEFRGATWFCKTKKGPSEKIEYIPEQSKVMGATIHCAFTQFHEEKEFNTNHTYFIEVNSETKPESRIIQMNAEELVMPNKLKIALKAKADVLLMDQSVPVVNALAQLLKKQNAPVIRLVDRLGYDPQSGCYLFGKMAYDQRGQRISANNHGFFPALGLRCSSSAIIEYGLDKHDSVDLKSVIMLLHQIYGNRALFALSYFIATLLKHEFLAQHRAFPFLSITGTKGFGKTTLVDFLCNMFFQLWSGITVKDASTIKALARLFYHRNALVTPFNEANGSLPNNLPENALLDAYHGGSLYDRAAKSQDSEVIGQPFDAGLLFVQNREPFTIAAFKERVVTLRFLNYEEGGINDDSRKAMRCLEQYNTIKRATIGHELMGKLPELKIYIFTRLIGFQDWLTESGVQSPRVAFTHAVIGSTFWVLLEMTGFKDVEIEKMRVIEERRDIALLKDRKSDGSNDASAAFFEAFEQLSTNSVEVRGECFELKEHVHYLKDGDKLYVRFEEVKRILKGAGYEIPVNLARSLEVADVIVDKGVKIHGVGGVGKEKHPNRWVDNKQRCCWILRRPLD